MVGSAAIKQGRSANRKHTYFFFWPNMLSLLAHPFRVSILRLAVTCDFQQCGILTSVDSDEPVQPPFKLRNSK